MITLQTNLTPQGIECSTEVLGKVATIVPVSCCDGRWEWKVQPYALPPYEWNMVADFRSLKAAEAYALALAFETYERRGVAPARSAPAPSQQG